MPKKGQRLPWRLTFEWSNGVRGASAHYDRDDAEREAAKIQRAAEARGLTVQTTVGPR